MGGFRNANVDVPILLEDLEREYCRITQQAYPIPEMVYVRSWMLFRVKANGICTCSALINTVF